MFFIWVASYVCLGMALYRALSFNFHLLDSSVLSIVGLLTRRYDFSNLDIGHSAGILIWRLMIVSFMIFAMGSLTAYVTTYNKQHNLHYIPLSFSADNCYTELSLQSTSHREESNIQSERNCQLLPTSSDQDIPTPTTIRSNRSWRVWHSPCCALLLLLVIYNL